MKLPLWLKILFILIPAILIFTVLGDVSPYLIGPLLTIVIILFPGPDRKNPRLVRWLPWFWSLEVVVSVGFGILALLGKNIGGDETRQPTGVELVATIVLGVPLIWTLATRHRVFRPLLVFSTVVFVGIAIWVFSTSAGDYKAVFELVGELFTQIVVTAYLLMKVRGEEGKLAEEQK